MDAMQTIWLYLAILICFCRFLLNLLAGPEVSRVYNKSEKELCWKVEAVFFLEWSSSSAHELHVYPSRIQTIMLLKTSVILKAMWNRSFIALFKPMPEN